MQHHHHPVRVQSPLPYPPFPTCHTLHLFSSSRLTHAASPLHNKEQAVSELLFFLPFSCVMWPRLVASKLLHRLSSSNSSAAADFPTTTTATSNWDEIINLQRSCDDGKETRNYKYVSDQSISSSFSSTCWLSITDGCGCFLSSLSKAVC